MCGRHGSLYSEPVLAGWNGSLDTDSLKANFDAEQWELKLLHTGCSWFVVDTLDSVALLNDLSRESHMMFGASGGQEMQRVELEQIAGHKTTEQMSDWGLEREETDWW